MKGGGRWERPPGRDGDEVGSGVFKRGTVLRSVQVGGAAPSKWASKWLLLHRDVALVFGSAKGANPNRNPNPKPKTCG